RRRAVFAASLSIYSDVVDRWAALPPAVEPLRRDSVDATRLWERGVPLIADRPPALPVDAVENLLGPVMELIVSLRAEEGPPLQRFAEAWDARTIGPMALLPAKGRLGSVDPELGMTPRTLGALAALTLRPFLAAYFRDLHPALEDGAWSLGASPSGGAPPGF